VTAPKRLRIGATAALLAALSVILVAPAIAQEAEEPATSPPELLAVDAGDESYVLIRSAERPSNVEVSVNGTPASVSNPIPLARSSLGAETILVIDNSVRAEDLLDEFISAATDYVRRAPDREQIGVYTTGGGANLRIGLSSSHDRTIEAIQGIVASNDEGKLWDGVRGAALDLKNGDGGRTNLIMFIGSGDGGSLTSVATARGAVLAANASAFVIAREHEDVPLDALANVASVSIAGGMAATTDQALIASYGGSVSDLIGGTYVVPFRFDDLTGGQSLTVVVDGTRVDASYIAGAVTSGASLEPYVDSGSGGLPFLQGETAKTLGLVFGAIAAALGAWAVAAMFQKDPSGLNSVLQAYADPYGAAAPEDGEEGSGFAKNLLLKRAVEITESFAERQGFLVRTENALERADLPLRAGEALTVYAGIVLTSLVVGLLLGGTLIVALILGAIGTMIPPAAVNFMAGRRKKAFLAQLPDTLQLLSSTLKAGYSFMQGVEAVSQEVADPMGNELRRVVTEAQLGRPVEEALDASAERMDSPDFAWAVMAVRIQREVGGNLSELLLTVSETMTARERLRRDVAALTAEGKMSAIVLGALPILLGFAMYVMNPEYIGTLFEESIGKVLLVISVISVLIGFAWMKKIIDIDI
jgi:tight adherence protein B